MRRCMLLSSSAIGKRRLVQRSIRASIMPYDRTLAQPVVAWTHPQQQRSLHSRWLSTQPSLKEDQSWNVSTKGRNNKSRKQQRRQQAQQEKAQMKKQARQERHTQQLETAQQDKKLRELSRQRKNAAKSVPYWLGNDIDCFEQTMSALNIDLDYSSNTKLDVDWMKNGIVDQHGRSGGGGGVVMAEYRQMYKDSIPTFFNLLSEDPSSISPETEACLDRLVDAGFADLQWAKHFRKIHFYQSSYEKLTKRISKKNTLHKERKKELIKFQNELTELERYVPPTLDQMREAAARKQQEASTTLLEKAVLAVSAVWNFDSKAEEELRDQVELQEQQHTQQLEKQRRKVQQAQEAVNAVARQIKRLKTERDSFKPLLTETEYEQAGRVAQEVMKEFCTTFAFHIQQRHTRMIEQYQTLDAKTDLTKPHDWYPHSRLDRRKIIFHGGPTNSGKTYEALQSLKRAEKGLYLGPLRLLAAEVYENLTAQGLYTSLFTGQEQREVPFATHTAATVEMAPTTQDFDVVVIDEIQMIADKFRGFAWTKALLGIRCKEIHVCGGLEAQRVVKRLAEFCGDDFELKQYERFSDLQVAQRSIGLENIGSYNTVQAGDCVVAFSRNDIFAIKREIENTTNYKCCVIYGSLPPATRTDQARRFNDPNSGYDILVASDAIGMGLNLNIRRIIFNSMFKSNGETIVRLDHSSVKQIGGRAGRRNSPFPNGEVTVRVPEDMDHLRECMSRDVAPIPKAGLLPTDVHIQLFSEALQKYQLGHDHDNLHKILTQFEEMAKTKGDFFVCRQTSMRLIAKWLDDVPLSINDKYLFCMAPVATNSKIAMNTLKKFAQKHAAGEASGLSRTMIPKPAKTFADLSQLCGIHQDIELFLWMTNRFPGNAVEEQQAIAMKDRAISYINEGLANSENLHLNHCYIKRDSMLRRNWKKNRESAEDDVIAEIDRLDEYLVRSQFDDEI